MEGVKRWYMVGGDGYTVLAHEDKGADGDYHFADTLSETWVRWEDYGAMFEAAEKRAADLAARGAVGLQIASENLRAVSLELAAARRKIAELEADKI